MNAMDVKCPLCGTVNKSLNLEETDGWMECEKCNSVLQVLKYAKTTTLSVNRLEECQLLVPLSRRC